MSNSYLEALITKWRGKGIRFTIDSHTDPIRGAYFELSAMILGALRYLSINAYDLKEGCQVIDEGLTQYFGGKGDQHKPHAGEEQAISEDTVRPKNPGPCEDHPGPSVEQKP